MAKSCICELYPLGLINNKYVINEVFTVFCSPLFATTRQVYCPQHRLVTPIKGVRPVCCVPTGSALETQILTLPSVRNKPTFQFSSESRTVTTSTNVKKWKQFSLKEKLKISEGVDKVLKKSDIAKNFLSVRQHFQLLLKTVTKLKKSAESHSIGPQRKRIKKADYEQIDKAVYAWFLLCARRRWKLTDQCCVHRLRNGNVHSSMEKFALNSYNIINCWRKSGILLVIQDETEEPADEVEELDPELWRKICERNNTPTDMTPKDFVDVDSEVTVEKEVTEEDIINSVMQEKGDVSESEEEAETSDSVSEKKKKKKNVSCREALNVANDLGYFWLGRKNVPEDVTKSASAIVNYLEDSVVKCSVQKKTTDFF
ncbi:hypothetical protein C0J52_24985 [Blattella germanica]|nr:hypothetical protein C0J52_24985 [Blattella germanica]